MRQRTHACLLASKEPPTPIHKLRQLKPFAKPDLAATPALLHPHALYKDYVDGFPKRIVIRAERGELVLNLVVFVGGPSSTIKQSFCLRAEFSEVFSETLATKHDLPDVHWVFACKMAEFEHPRLCNVIEIINVVQEFPKRLRVLVSEALQKPCCLACTLLCATERLLLLRNLNEAWRRALTADPFPANTA